MPSYKFTYYFEDDEGCGEEDLEVPGKFEVCSRCRGEGKHTNPSIDGNGLTANDFAEDLDFADDYFSGVYDVLCTECGGERVVRVPDLDRCTDEQRRKVEAHLEYEAEIRREAAHEQRLRDRGIEY